MVGYSIEMSDYHDGISVLDSPQLVFLKSDYVKPGFDSTMVSELGWYSPNRYNLIL